MVDMLENGKMEKLREDTLNILDLLIKEEVTRNDVDSWVLSLDKQYGTDLLDKLWVEHLALSELIDALGLVTTPGDKSEWLYDRDDFQSWLDDYNSEISNK